MNDHPNAKVDALFSHVGEFASRDFLDLAAAALDQANVRSATANRACGAVKALIVEETPEEEAEGVAFLAL